MFQESDFGYSDAVGESNDFESILIRSVPSAGTLTLNGAPVDVDDEVNVTQFPDFIYTPAPEASGSNFDSFDFSVRDDRKLITDIVNTLTFDVAEVNDAPTAVDDPFDTDEEVVLTGNVLDNDTDIDGDILSVNTTPVVDPANGSVQLNTDGTFTYTPDLNFAGSDSFTYEIDDGRGGTAQAIADILSLIHI